MQLLVRMVQVALMGFMLFLESLDATLLSLYLVRHGFVLALKECLRAF